MVVGSLFDPADTLGVWYRYRMVTRTKTVTWAGVRWTAVDDARLLVGVNEYGVGNWDSIRSDSTLGLTKKVGE